MKEKIPRDLLGALGGFVLGIAFLAVGVALLGWAVLAKVEVAKGIAVAKWAAQHSPVPLPMEAADLGNSVVNSPSIWFIAAFGVMALMIAFSCLRGARRNARPAGVSDDGEARLELEGAYQRVGWPLQGVIVLGSNNSVGQRYNVRVECRRLKRDGGYGGTDYSDSAEMQAVAGAGGARLPFRFEIPLTAPPSQPQRFSLQDRREWHISCARAKAWFGWSIFDLQVEPGPEQEVAEALAAMPPVVPGPFPWKFIGGFFAGALVLFFLIDAVISFFSRA